MKVYLSFLVILFECLGSMILAPVALAKSPIDNFIPFLEYEKFSHDLCKNSPKTVVCGHSSDNLQIYAEKDTEDSFFLTIKKRENPGVPFEIDEFLVRFTYRDGVIIKYQSDYYVQFAEFRKNKAIPMGIRRWLVDIMASLRPGFVFTPQE
ncbi:MAG: hypothetical protein QNL04_05500 [SAR324 cluster bacterium]|nr:hypothetical protein [SAR324 cluster bacterium]